MAERKALTPRQRRTGGYVFGGVGLVNLVVGVVAGALVTIVTAVVMLIVGTALVVSALPRGDRPADR